MPSVGVKSKNLYPISRFQSDSGSKCIKFLISDVGDFTVLVKFGQNRDLVGLFKSLPLPGKWTDFDEIWLK